MSLLKTKRAVIVLLLIGGLGSVWVLSQPWVTATFVEPNMPTTQVIRTGATLYPASLGAAWLVVACAIALFAFGPKVRTAIGVILIFAGGLILMSPIAFLLTDAMESLPQEYANDAAYRSFVVETSPVVWLLFVTGLVTELAGLAIMMWSQSWGGLSSKQSNSVEPATRSDWDALDAGDDPTLDR